MKIDFEQVAVATRIFTSKDHQECSSYSLMNNAKYLQWRHKNFNRLSDCDFYSCNRGLFLESFGEQNFCLISEYMIWHCWAIEYKGYIFLIFSCRESTKYEVVYTGNWSKFSSDTKMGDVIIEFNLWLVKKIFN